jgi:hypothetical protein
MVVVGDVHAQPHVMCMYYYPEKELVLASGLNNTGAVRELFGLKKK